jgi:hypothetical protein
MARREDWTSLEKSPIELHTLYPNRPWDQVTREHLIRSGVIVDLANRPTLRLTNAERIRYTVQASQQAAQCFHAEQSDEYPCMPCVERYSKTLDQTAEKHVPCVNLADIESQWDAVAA